jgi:hypothetical protein
MTIIPAGLTSSVTAGGKNFILQTEFIAGEVTPDSDIISGRIKTTVAVQGQVVHKVEKAYVGEADAEDPMLAAEKAVKSQHLQVAKTVSTEPKEFLKSVSELTVSAGDRLALIPGIARVNKIDLTNLDEIAEINDSENPLLKNMGLIRDLVVAISQNTRLGKLKKMVGAVDDNKFILIGAEGKTYFLDLKDNVDVSSVLQDLEKAKA